MFDDLIRSDRFATRYSTMVEALYDNPDLSLKMRELLAGR